VGLRDRLMEIDSLFPRRPQLRPWRRRPTQRAGAVPLGHRSFKPIQRAPRRSPNPDDRDLVVHSFQSLHSFSLDPNTPELRAGFPL
jgi:hypothetical protein